MGMTSKSDTTTSTLYLWEEPYPVQQALQDLAAGNAHHGVLKEFYKALVLLHNFKDYGIELPNTPETQEKLLQQFCQYQKLPNLQALEGYLAKTRQDKAELLDRLIYAEKVTLLAQAVISQTAVREHFLEKKAQLDQIRFQLIRVDSSFIANDLQKQLKDGADFGDLARQHSSGAEAPHGGVIGPVPVATLHKSLSENIVLLQPEEISSTFSIEDKGGSTYFIARLLQFDRAELTPALESRIRDDLFQRWLEQKILLANPRFD